MMSGPPPNPDEARKPEDQKRFLEIRPTEEQARKEITASMVLATGTQGQAHAEALWTAYEEESSSRGMPDEKQPDGGAARRAVAEHQLELSDATVKSLIASWAFYGSDDFLPVVRREAAKRGNDPNALIPLCTLKPEEARPLVLAEMIRPDSNFFKGSYAPMELLSVPPMPLPGLDNFFRSKITDPDESPGQVFPLLACFGSANLLPAALNLLQHPNPGYPPKADYRIAFYFYWMRCDPEAAKADFTQVFKSNPQDYWAFLNNAFIGRGSDVALPLLLIVLKSDDASMASSAMDRLLQRGGDGDIDPMLTAMERLQNDKEYGKWLRKDASIMLSDSRWHPTAVQKKRLEALASTPKAN